ncbi:MAG: hypothetical protein K2I30_04485 [Clostridia bacterium]|nr:hypothetical protein [Clostridia bacterium]
MKKRFFLICILIIFLLSVTAFSACDNGRKGPPDGEESTVNVLEGGRLNDSSLIYWIGRREYSAQDKAVYIYYTATGFTVKFTGTKLEVTFKADNTSSSKNRPYFVAMCDGQTAQQGFAFCLTEENQTVTVADTLKNGTHTVTVQKRSEPENSLTAITAIKTDGEFKTPPKHTGLKFQILGGSGISGHGCLGKPNEGWTTENSSSLQGFGYLAAQKFGAETQFVSNSGMGLVWGYRNVAPLTKAYESVGLIAEYGGNGSTKAVKAHGEWNHLSWTPDVVIINIGGNDWNAHISGLTGAARTAAEKEFKQAVVSLLDRIHGLYPQAKIVWTCNSIRSGNGALANEAISALEYKSAVKAVSVSDVKDGADNHASAATQAENAQTVVDAITSAFGIAQI